MRQPFLHYKKRHIEQILDTLSINSRQKKNVGEEPVTKETDLLFSKILKVGTQTLLITVSLSSCSTSVSLFGNDLVEALKLDTTSLQSDSKKSQLNPVHIAKVNAEYAELGAVFGVNPPMIHDITEVLTLTQNHESVYNVMRDGFRFDLTVDNDRIQVQRNWYVKHPAYLSRVIERARPYWPYIISEIEKRNMPQEFALLPIVESAFDPFAYSHGRAAGMWQFIPSTGKIFGLKQNWWYDGRRDIVASTDAALNYLDNLQKQFDGDWLLALASYNSGSGTVKKAIRNNKKRGKATDFWSLNLPKETRAYVPKLIALSQIFNEPHKYAVVLDPVPYQKTFELVDTGGQIDLAQAADLAGIDLDTLYRFNPAFNRWATDPDGPHHLAIPLENARQFKLAIQELPASERVNWTRYTIRSGDSLITIAKHYNTTANHLKQVNNLSGSMIRAGKTLLIPISSRPTDEYSLSASQRLASKQNRTRSGKDKITYQVRSGDSFWDIARKYKVSVRTLAKWNGMAPTDPLNIGKKLVIWTEQKPANMVANLGVTDRPDTDRNITRKVHYMVRNGDSLARIANRFNVSVRDIARWNTLNTKKYLQPGQRLTLYVDVTTQM